MKIIDIIREDPLRYPVRRGAVSDAASNRGSLLVTLPIKDFLALTVPEWPSGAARDEYLDTAARRGLTAGSFKPSTLPSLYINLTTARVVSHEGRHRAYVLAQTGQERMPVVITFYNDAGKLKGHPERSNPEEWEYAQFELGDLPPVLRAEFTSIKVSTESWRGGPLKGSIPYHQQMRKSA